MLSKFPLDRDLTVFETDFIPIKNIMPHLFGSIFSFDLCWSFSSLNRWSATGCGLDIVILWLSWLGTVRICKENISWYLTQNNAHSKRQFSNAEGFVSKHRKGLATSSIFFVRFSVFCSFYLASNCPRTLEGLFQLTRRPSRAQHESISSSCARRSQETVKGNCWFALTLCTKLPF